MKTRFKVLPEFGEVYLERSQFKGWRIDLNEAGVQALSEVTDPISLWMSNTDRSSLEVEFILNGRWHYSRARIEGNSIVGEDFPHLLE